MIYDELLEKINRYSKTRSLIDTIAWKSLKRIIELHSPREAADMIICEGCSNSEFYPWDSCETIQVIKKELK